MAVLVAALLTLACSRPPFGRDCTDELRVHLTPRDTTVVVGTAFRASVALSTCGGYETLHDTFTWTSFDPSVAEVGTTDGRVIARALGETRIGVTGARYGQLTSLRVVVVP